jgi:hypothetical protein
MDEDIPKLLFLWDECHPAATGVSGVLFKTRQKIKEDKTRHVPHRKTVRVAWAGGAAASFILAATLSFLFLPQSEKNDTLKMEQYMQANAPGEEVEEVTLVVSAQKKIQIANHSKITYSATGEVQVNSQKLRETKSEPTTATVEEEYNQVIVPKGKRSMVVLADSSKIWINSGSTVVYPRSFGKRRNIFVDGEVYLQVTPDATKPFIVSTSTFEVQVVGTSFNVAAYKGRPEASVVLEEGAVDVKDHLNRHVTMQPNERVKMNEAGISKIETVNVSDYVAWVNGVWILNGKPLKEVLSHLAEYYGQPIDCDPSIEDEPVYGKLFLNDDLDKVLKSIRQALSATSHDEEKRVFTHPSDIG